VSTPTSASDRHTSPLDSCWRLPSSRLCNALPAATTGATCVDYLETVSYQSYLKVTLTLYRNSFDFTYLQTHYVIVHIIIVEWFFLNIPAFSAAGMHPYSFCLVCEYVRTSCLPYFYALVDYLFTDTAMLNISGVCFDSVPPSSGSTKYILHVSPPGCCFFAVCLQLSMIMYTLRLLENTFILRCLIITFRHFYI